MVKVLIIVDKFKGSLTAREASSAIAKGMLSTVPDLEIEEIPLADGGEGTLDAVEIFGDERILVNSTDPLGRKIIIPVLRTDNRILCEMAKSTGLYHLSREERNPMNTSSYGLGLVLREVAQMGYKKILIGIGGSATNDGGTGMLEALGYHFIDSTGGNARGDKFISGRDLINITGIDDTSVPGYIRELEIEVACDVRNPLTGPYGATHVYGPQKGATAEDIESLESGMQNFAKVSARYLGKDLSDLPGSGAAGGVGYALAAFMGAKLLCGWRVLFDFLEIESKIAQADVVITGEGRVDAQSISGKLLDGVAEMCLKTNSRLWVVCGDNTLPDNELERIGVERLFAVSQFEPSKERAIANAGYHIEKISRFAATFLKPPTSNRQTIKIK